MAPLCSSDPDPLSIILEGDVHIKAMMPSNQGGAPKSKKGERIPLRAEDYPSASNGAGAGEGVNVAFVNRRAKRIYGNAARLLKCFISSGVGKITVSRSGTSVPDAGDKGPAAVLFGDDLAASGGCGGSTCSVPEWEVRVMFDRALREIPELSLSVCMRRVVDDRNVQETVDEIMAKLAQAEGQDGDGGDEAGDYDENLDTDAVLITVCNCLDGDGTGYIEMREVASCGDRSEQDHDVSYTGGRFLQ